MISFHNYSTTVTSLQKCQNMPHFFTRAERKIFVKFKENNT